MVNCKLYSKGDIIAIVETRVTQYAIGSGRPSETSTSIRIVRVESASRDGVTVKSYRTYPTSPAYKYENRYNRYKLLPIQRGTLQANARRLFEASKTALDYDSKESAQKAVLEA